MHAAGRVDWPSSTQETFKKEEQLQRPCVHCVRQAATGLPVYMASTSHYSPQAAFLYGDLVKPHRRWSRGFHTLVHFLKHISHKRPLSSACRPRRGFCASWQMQTSWGGGTASSCSALLSTGATSAWCLMPWSVPAEAAAWCLIKDRPPACNLCRQAARIGPLRPSLAESANCKICCLATVQHHLHVLLVHSVLSR